MTLPEHIERFRKNLRYFKEHYPQIYEYLDCEATLVYEEGQINIFSKGIKLYPKGYEKSVQKNIETFLESDYAPVYIKPSDPNEYMHHRLQYWALKRIEKKMVELQGKSVKVKELDFIPFLVVYGLGLGYHIPALLKEKECGIVIVIEPDRANLVASMFTVDWEELFATHKIYFVLGSDAKKQANEVVRIVKANNIMYIYHLLIYVHFFEGVEEFNFQLAKEVLKEPGSWGFVDDELVSMEHNFVNFFAQRPLYSGKKVQTKVPVFVVGSGPSLDQTIDIIRKYQKDALIFAAGTAIKPLVRAGIVPDYTFALERLKITYNAFVQAVPKEILQDLSIIASSVVYPPFFEISKDVKMLPRVPDTASLIFFELGLSEPVPFQTPTVTNMALAFAAFLGFREIYLFGVDLGFKDPKYHHSKNTIYSDQGEFKTEKMESFRKVPGNFCDEVYTTDIYELAKDKMELLAKSYKIHIYNSADGAKIEGTIPLEAQKIFVDSYGLKERAKEEIERLFVSDYATKENLTYVQRRYERVIEEIEEILEWLGSFQIDKERFEKELFEVTTQIYKRLEHYYAEQKDMTYQLIRGTLYHFASFFYSYLSRLPIEQKYRFYQYSARTIAIVLKKVQKKIKNIQAAPIIKV